MGRVHVRCAAAAGGHLAHGWRLQFCAAWMVNELMAAAHIETGQREIRWSEIHYHHERNHQGKDNLLLFPSPVQRLSQKQGKVRCRQRLGRPVQILRARRSSARRFRNELRVDVHGCRDARVPHLALHVLGVCTCLDHSRCPRGPQAAPVHEAKFHSSRCWLDVS
jgi:hypothetical protein